MNSDSCGFLQTLQDEVWVYCDFEHSLKVSLKCKAWHHFDEQILLESKGKCSSIMVSMLFFGWISLGSYPP